MAISMRGGKSFTNYSLIAHVFVAGFLLPLTVFFGTGVISGVIEAWVQQVYGLEMVLSLSGPISLLLLMVAFWFGVKYWAKYFNTKFGLVDKSFSLQSAGSLLVLIWLYNFLIKYNLSLLNDKDTAYFLGFIVGVMFVDFITVIPFYFSTKKYITGIVNKI